MQFRGLRRAAAIGLASAINLLPLSGSATTISAMIPVLNDPVAPRVVLTAPVSTIVEARVDCETWCLYQGFNNPALFCRSRNDNLPSVIGTTLPPGNYLLWIYRGTGEGVCTGFVRVTP